MHAILRSDLSDRRHVTFSSLLEKSCYFTTFALSARGINLRKKKGEKSWVEKSDITTQEKESERKNRCDKCRWYEHSTQRDFYRKVGPKDENGERTTIKEIRAVCRSPKSSARNHLVKNDSNRDCFEEGTYEIEEKKEKTKKNKEIMLTNGLNGETKTFKKKRSRLVLMKP
jgi:hypothetical protein